MKILTLNTSMLSFLFGLIDAKKDIIPRTNLIANKILNIKDEYDIICFQEMFDAGAKSVMKNKLKADFPHICEDERRGAFFSFGVNSGLMIFSKHKITNSVIKTFDKKSGDSFFSKKSIMGIEIISEEKKEKMCIFTTHMQAGGNNKWYLKWLDLFTSGTTNQIRLSQLKEAKKVIMEFNKNDLPAIYAGDFNINAFDPTIVIDPDNRVKIAANEMINYIFPDSESFDISVNGEKYSTYENKRIDYVLKFNMNGESFIIDYFTQEDTDHRGVVFDF